jgi:hypothetical protein
MATAGLDAQVVAQAVLAVRARLRALWPVEVSDTTALVVGACATMRKADATIDLACERRLAPIVLKNLSSLAINAAEFTVLLKTASIRTVGTLGALAESEWFKTRKAGAEKALSCTLAEASGALLWAKPAVQLATVLSFQCSFDTIQILDSVFGSVVRSDVRRVEDLHFETLESEPDPNAVCAALELVARLVL